MIEQFKYINSVGQEVDFGSNGIFANENELRNVEYSYSMNYGEVSLFQNALYERKLPIIIVGSNDISDAILDTFEMDINRFQSGVSNALGKIVINGYYIKCLVLKANPSGYTVDGTNNYELTILTPNPKWYKETLFQYDKASLNAQEQPSEDSEVIEEVGENEDEDETEESGLVIENESLEFLVGKEVQIDVSGATVTISYSILNNNIATITESGLLKAVSEGSTTLTVTSGELTISETITVNSYSQNFNTTQPYTIGYRYSYPYGYFYKEYNISTITNNSNLPSEFEMCIHGEVSGPVIQIGNNIYKLNMGIGSGERVIINTINKTIYLYDVNGNQSNVFFKQDDEYNIFEKIPSGISNVKFDSDTLEFTVTLLEERSTPKWIT